MTEPRKPTRRAIASKHVEIRLRGGKADVSAALDRLRRLFRIDWAGKFRDDGKSGRLYVAATLVEQTPSEVEAERDRLRAELDDIRDRANARSEKLLAERDACPPGDDAKRSRLEYAASELRMLVGHLPEEAGQ